MPVIVGLVDGTIPVAEDFNGNYRRLNQAVGVNTAIVSYAPGDVLYASATDTLVRLPIGNPGDVLSVVGGVPAWTSSGATAAGTWQQRNLQGTLTAATLTVTADSLVLRGSGGATKLHEAVGATVIDPSAAGLNGRDQAGAFTGNQDLHAYWISNGVFVRGVWADSAPPTGPDLTTLPAFAGYTYWAYIGSYRWGAASSFTTARQRGRTVFYEGAQVVVSDGQAISETAVSVAGFVPVAALTWTGLLTAAYEGMPSYNFRLRLISGVDYDLPPAGANGYASLRAEVTFPNVSQQYFYLYGTAPGATIGHYGYVRAYTVGNGGD